MAVIEMFFFIFFVSNFSKFIVQKLKNEYPDNVPNILIIISVMIMSVIFGNCLKAFFDNL